jgi:hypothetical protein
MSVSEAGNVFVKFSGEKTLVRFRTALCLTLGTALLALPIFARTAGESRQSSSELRLAGEFQADAQRDAQDRAQQKLDAEQDARDREQEKRDQEQERVDHMQELYSDGRGFLDEEAYGDAVRKFSELAAMNGPQTDAALYWKAYAENRQGKREAALATTADLKRRFPQSRWKKDAEALEIEIKQSSGGTVNPDTQSDQNLKFLALQGLMRSNPEKAIPLVTKYLDGPGSPKEKREALFMLAQSGSPQAHETLKKIALGQSNPELQRKAVEYLGIMGGKGNADTLAEIYSTTKDPDIKRAVIRSYMVSGDHEHLFALAKSEKDEGLKREAIRNLGISGAQSELLQLYQSGDNSTEAKKEVLQALFLSGDSQELAQVAQQEKNPELRRAAIRNLGLMGGKEPELQSIYAKETDRGVKEEVLNAYFLGGNTNGLIAVARTEKDPELKKKAVEKLSLMNSKEATDYLMEILQK